MAKTVHHQTWHGKEILWTLADKSHPHHKRLQSVPFANIWPIHSCLTRGKITDIWPTDQSKSSLEKHIWTWFYTRLIGMFLFALQVSCLQNTNQPFSGQMCEYASVTSALLKDAAHPIWPQRALKPLRIQYVCHLSPRLVNPHPPQILCKKGCASIDLALAFKPRWHITATWIYPCKKTFNHFAGERNFKRYLHDSVAQN